VAGVLQRNDWIAQMQKTNRWVPVEMCNSGRSLQCFPPEQKRRQRGFRPLLSGLSVLSCNTPKASCKTSTAHATRCRRRSCGCTSRSKLPSRVICRSAAHLRPECL